MGYGGVMSNVTSERLSLKNGACGAGVRQKHCYHDAVGSGNLRPRIFVDLAIGNEGQSYNLVQKMFISLRNFKAA